MAIIIAIDFSNTLCYDAAMPFEKHCLNCSNKFTASRRSRVYCSRHCQSLHLHQRGCIPPKPRQGKQLLCQACHQLFYVASYRSATAKYCSRSCLAKIHLAPYVSVYGFMPSNKPPRHYKLLTTPDGRRLRLHRWVMEKHLGRPLQSDEHVHHIDGNPDNNDLSNLCILSNSEHGRLSYIERQQH